MTDGGYEEWKTHVLIHQDGEPNTPLDYPGRDTGDASDIFSDSVSSLSFSDDEDRTPILHHMPGVEAKHNIGVTASRTERKENGLNGSESTRRSLLPILRDFSPLPRISPHRQPRKLEKFEIRSDGSGDEDAVLTEKADYDSLDEFFQQD